MRRRHGFRQVQPDAHGVGSRAADDWTRRRIIVTLQNGIGNVEIIRVRLPPNACRIGLDDADVRADRAGPDRGKLHRPWRDAISGRAFGHGRSGYRATLRPDESRAASAASLEPDIELKIWKKLVVNCCLNTMCAITGQRVGTVSRMCPMPGRFWMVSSMRSWPPRN